MVCLRFKPVVALMVASSMFVSSTGAIAAANHGSTPQQIDAWAALSALTAGAPAAALCGAAVTAAAAAAQPAAGCVLPAVDAAPVAVGPPPPTPVPPVEPVGGGLGISPLFLALGAIAVGALAYFLLRHKHHHAVSPA